MLPSTPSFPASKTMFVAPLSPKLKYSSFQESFTPYLPSTSEAIFSNSALYLLLSHPLIVFNIVGQIGLSSGILLDILEEEFGKYMYAYVPVLIFQLNILFILLFVS